MEYELTGKAYENGLNPNQPMVDVYDSTGKLVGTVNLEVPIDRVVDKTFRINIELDPASKPKVVG